MFPFLALFLLLSLVSILLDRYYISTILDDRISRQTERISLVLSNSEFVLNPVYLNKLKDVIEGDVAVFERKGRVIATTFTKKALKDFIDSVDINQFFTGSSQGQSRVYRKVINQGASSYLLIARPLFAPSDSEKEMILCIVFPLADVINAKSKVTKQMFIVGLCGLFFAALAAYIISKSVTIPIKNLVNVTATIADGHFEKKVPLPSIEELTDLAYSFNAMTVKLKEYEKKIVQSSRLAAAGKVTAALAHEIRNPLSGIKMMTQLLRDRSGPENIRIIKPVMDEIGRLERIVNDLTDVMKPLKLVFSACDINELINEIIPVIKPKLSHLNISLLKDLTETLPEVEADRDKLKQVIWNIIINSMDSMPYGGIIKISTKYNRFKESLEIIIEDEGEGINEQELENMFSYFYTTKPEGLGLGLSISKEIIEKHGGTMAIENRNVKGARATILIPCKSKKLGLGYNSGQIFDGRSYNQAQKLF